MPDEEMIRDDEIFQFLSSNKRFMLFSLAFYAIFSSKRVFFASNKLEKNEKFHILLKT